MSKQDHLWEDWLFLKLFLTSVTGFPKIRPNDLQHRRACSHFPRRGVSCMLADFRFCGCGWYWISRAGSAKTKQRHTLADEDFTSWGGGVFFLGNITTFVHRGRQKQHKMKVTCNFNWELNPHYSFITPTFSCCISAAVVPPTEQQFPWYFWTGRVCEVVFLVAWIQDHRLNVIMLAWWQRAC